MKEVNLRYQLTEKQLRALNHKAKFILFGGSMGAGKTILLINKVLAHALEYKGSRVVIVRKELSVMRQTTIVSFFEICPPELVAKYNQQKEQITLVNGSVIFFKEADITKDKLLNKIKGLSISFFAIDEANEVPESVYTTLKTRLRWVCPDGTKPKYGGMLTSNPENCWLIPTFIEPENPNKDEVFIQALPKDLKHIHPDYYERLLEAYKNDPIGRRKYLDGDWSLADVPNQLIPSKYLDKAKKPLQKNLLNKIRGIISPYNDDNDVTSLGVDVARYGADNTVYMLLQKGNLIDIISKGETSITEVAEKVKSLINEYNLWAGNVGIDSVGIGAGAYDILKAEGISVQALEGGRSQVELIEEEESSIKFVNFRAQMFWQLREDLINEEIGNLYSLELHKELSAITYEIRGDKSVKIASKDDIKKKLGKSPDLADALAYANWVRKLRTKEEFLGSYDVGYGLPEKDYTRKNYVQTPYNDDFNNDLIYEDWDDDDIDLDSLEGFVGMA